MLFPYTPNPHFSFDIFQQPVSLHLSPPPGEWCGCLSVHSLMDNSNSIGLCTRTGQGIFADNKISNSSTQKVRRSCCCIPQFGILPIVVIWRDYCPVSGQLLMPVAISVLLCSFNYQNRTAASALSAGPELPPELCKGLLGKMLLVLDLAQGLCCQKFNSVSCGLQVCSSVPWHLLVC